MNRDLDRFNWLARYYDSLAGIVFGKALHKSQIYFLRSVPEGCNLLILGGGAGKVLTALTEVNPSCNIWYVEASAEMLSMAGKGISGEFRNRVSFIHGTERSIPEGIKFDAVMTNFFLDLYPNQQLSEISDKIYNSLGKKGLWLVSDFVDGGKWWQRMLLWVMYRFFVITCDIKASGLPSWEIQLTSAGMKEITSELFFGGFIKSAVYEKDEATKF
jgi:tRNA (cmo5U34)-methyltransferase